MLFEYQAQPMITPTEVINFMDGLIFGFTGKEDLQEIQKCLTHVPQLADQITAVVSDLEKKDLQDILKAVGEVGQIIADIPTDFADCTSMQGDLKRIEAWGQIFKDPVKLMEVVTGNVLKNYSSILGDIGKIAPDFSSGDYKDAGTEVADVMVLAIGPIPEVTAWGQN